MEASIRESGSPRGRPLTRLETSPTPHRRWRTGTLQGGEIRQERLKLIPGACPVRPLHPAFELLDLQTVPGVVLAQGLHDPVSFHRMGAFRIWTHGANPPPGGSSRAHTRAPSTKVISAWSSVTNSCGYNWKGLRERTTRSPRFPTSMVPVSVSIPPAHAPPSVCAVMASDNERRSSGEPKVRVPGGGPGLEAAWTSRATAAARAQRGSRGATVQSDPSASLAPARWRVP
jgi:hypothetical protein